MDVSVPAMECTAFTTCCHNPLPGCCLSWSLWPWVVLSLML